jgi:hypothetical protein
MAVKAASREGSMMPLRFEPRTGSRLRPDHAARHGQTGGLEESGSEIDVLDDVVDPALAAETGSPSHSERHMDARS